MSLLNYLFGTPTTLDRNVNELDMTMIRHIVKCTAHWCAVNLGMNNERRMDMSIEVIPNLTERLAGEFIESQNKIVIYYNRNKTVRDLVMTTIHEYVHYLQPIRNNYKRMLKEYGYDSHPMEIEARNAEQKYFTQAWSYVKTKII